MRMVALGALCACAPAIAIAGPTVVNSDFSAGLTGWTRTPDALSEPAMNATTGPGPFGSSPSFRVNPGSSTTGVGLRGGVLSQVITLNAMQPVFVTGDLAIENLSGGPNAEGGTIIVAINGMPLHTFSVGMIAGPSVQLDSFASGVFMPAATGPHTLSISFARSFPNFVPNIIHYADSIAVVPGPGGAGLALSCLLLSRRRR